jgi:hypothetical protein
MALASTLLVSYPARGQSFGTIEGRNVEWNPKRKTAEGFVASYQNCVDDDKFVVTVPVTSWGNAQNLNVFATVESDEVDCSDKDRRADRPGACIDLGTYEPSPPSVTVNVGIRKVINADSAEGCAKDLNNAPINLYFLLVGTTSSTLQKYVYSKLTIDLVGPNAPGNLEAGSGENKLLLNWSVPSDKLIQGYRFFCAPAQTGPVPETASDATLTGGERGAGGAPLQTLLGAAGLAEGGSRPGAGAGGVSQTEATANGAARASDVATSSGSSDCRTDAFQAEDLAVDSAYACGKVDSATTTEGKTSWVTNGTEYAVGVAAVDSSGNVGPLSNLACATPQEVNDFYEVYRRAGGQGGGGLCTLGRTSTRLGPFGIALLGAVMAWRLRRQRERRS